MDLLTCLMTYEMVLRGSAVLLIMIVARTVGRAVSSLVRQGRYGITQKEERFLRFIDMDASYLSQVPYLFKPLQPLIFAIRDNVISCNQWLGLPWWAVLMLASLFVRATIFPLILVQMKRFSRIAPVSPALVLLKDAWKHSEQSVWGKLRASVAVYRALCRQEGFRVSTVFVYNLAYYPLLISMIFGIRQILAVPEIGESGFLWISTLSDMDPYFILPTLTVALYYYNFQRFITPENEHTLLTRIRRLCQSFLIVWYPFLCSWPAGIALYMCTNALVSVLQSSVMKTPWFMMKMNQKIVLYNQILTTVEYDKGMSEGMIRAIQKGEENFGGMGIKEAELLRQTKDMLAKLDKEEKEGLADGDGRQQSDPNKK